MAKFSWSTQLKTYLLFTGDKVLVEAATYDRLWSIGVRINDPDILKKKDRSGQNLQGKFLMTVRTTLKSRLFLTLEKQNLY